MNDIAGVSRDRNQIDAEHLRLLSIFHFVGAGLGFVGLVFVAAHFALFHAFLSNPQIWQDAKQGPPPAVFFSIFRWFYLVFALWLIASGVLNLLSAFFLRARRHRVFSMVVAGLNCLHMPLGTILGIFTFVVLSRGSVEKLYEPR